MRSLACTMFVGFALAMPVAAMCTAATPIAIADEVTKDGTVKSVDTTARTFVLTFDGKDHTIRVDDHTKYMLDGNSSTMDKVLTSGAKVKVTHKDMLASRIEATSTKAPPDRNPPPPKREPK